MVIGEALVDVIRGPEGDLTVPGGSPLNVAVGLARLGVPTHLIAELGDDANGWLVRDHLAKSGVLTGRIAVDSAGTSVATATIGSDGSATYEFDIRWAIETPEVEDPALLHVGSVGSWLEPGAASVIAAVRARSESTVASFDPNIRPALGGDRASVLRRVDDLAGVVDILKLSDEDAAWILPDATPIDTGRHFLARGVRLFAMTLGSEGSVIMSADHVVRIPAAAVAVVDTVGAGDAYMSGLLFSLASSELLARIGALGTDDLRELGATATASAAITVSRAGADPPQRTELEANCRGGSA